ncbi:MAG: hypothetical protein Q8N26_34745, partial [Myxococcales bacterium]|nr:hypothetical protein [Myxococcales bacterium]
MTHEAPLVLHAVAVVVVTQVLAAQQPEAQLAESHTQLPLRQRWPDRQAGPAPHRQAPEAQVSEPPVQAAQALPPPPHA